MKCDVCGLAERESRLIRYTLDCDGRLIVVDHVPASVCPHCGETSFTPEVAERLQKTVWERHDPVEVVETPVYEYMAS